MARASDLGLSFYVGPEIEFFLFGNSGAPEPLDVGTYFDLTPLDVGSDFRRRVIDYLEQFGVPVKDSHHAIAASQHEVDLRHTDALTMADSVMTFRLAVKEVAQELDVYATFMPKPIQGVDGSSLHTHMSLFEGDRNAFFDPTDRYYLSKTARSFVAGLLRHAREISAVTNQWVNSYKRLVPGFEAPLYVCWGVSNRSALVRVPLTKPGKEAAARIEYRAPDPACNPYLAFALILTAGLRGIEQEYELPAEATNDIYAMTEAERSDAGILPLPESRSAASVRPTTAAMERYNRIAFYFDGILVGKFPATPPSTAAYPPTLSKMPVIDGAIATRRVRTTTATPSRPGEFHPEPLTDPDLNLSIHPARAIDEELPPFVKTAGSSCRQLTL